MDASTTLITLELSSALLLDLLLMSCAFGVATIRGTFAWSSASSKALSMMGGVSMPLPVKLLIWARGVNLAPVGLKALFGPEWVKAVLAELPVGLKGDSRDGHAFESLELTLPSGDVVLAPGVPSS